MKNRLFIMGMVLCVPSMAFGATLFSDGMASAAFLSIDADEGHVDWKWLADLPAVRETEFLRHVRLPSPVVVKMNGRTGEGIIAKPSCAT